MIGGNFSEDMLSPESSQFCPAGINTIFRGLLFDSVFCPLNNFTLLKGNDKIGPFNIKDDCSLFLVTGNDDGINSYISKQVCLTVIFLRIDRLSLHTSPNSIAASFLLSDGLEQETPQFSLFLTESLCVCFLV